MKLPCISIPFPRIIARGVSILNSGETDIRGGVLDNYGCNQQANFVMFIIIFCLRTQNVL